MSHDDRELPRSCGICQGPVEGYQLRKCVGLGVSMLFYGLTPDQINPALRSLGEAPVERPDLRVWCPGCAKKIAAAAPALGGECALCFDRLRAHPEDVGLLAEPGCAFEGKALCRDCRDHVRLKEKR